MGETQGQPYDWNGATGETWVENQALLDAMFAPVCLRFRTYEPPQLTAAARAYMDAICADADVAEWCALAEREEHRIDKYEA